jgi:hypothetical protein
MRADRPAEPEMAQRARRFFGRSRSPPEIRQPANEGRMMQSQRFAGLALFSAAAVLLLLFSSPAIAVPTKTIECERLPDPNVEYATISIDLRTIYVHESIEDPGDDFEFETAIHTQVLPGSEQVSTHYCDRRTTWGEVNYGKPNLWIGDYKELNHGGRLEVSNVPTTARLYVLIMITEIDGGANPNDSIDLSPRPDDKGIRLFVYPNQRRAHVLGSSTGLWKPLTTGAENILPFGEERRFDGDGQGFTKIDDSMGLSIVIDGPKGVPVPSTATREEACRTYALTAVDQNRTATQRSCGFTSAEWSNNHQNHFDWCMRGDNNDRAASETARRQQMLTGCIKKGAAAGKEQTCRDYALAAVDQNRQAIQHGCGFTGLEWSNNHQSHFDWCMFGNNSNNAASEAAKRQDALLRCGSASSKQRTFESPRRKGAIVDNCVTFGKDCGGGGAHHFCRLKGYARASAWQHNRPGRTYVIGSQSYCDGSVCVGYQSITCER